MNLVHLLVCARIREGRRRVGHRADESDAASDGCTGDRVPVLLVSASRLTRMHVHVDEAGQPDHTPRGHAVQHWLEHGRGRECNQILRGIAVVKAIVAVTVASRFRDRQVLRWQSFEKLLEALNQQLCALHVRDERH